MSSSPGAGWRASVSATGGSAGSPTSGRPKKAEAYRRRFGAGELRVCDVASLKPADLPPGADLAWASFPCQDLSLAGAGAGLSGARSGTFHAFWDLMEELRAARGRAGKRGGRDHVPRRARLRDDPRAHGDGGVSIRAGGARCGPLAAAVEAAAFVVGTRDPAATGELGFGHTRALVEAHAALDPCLRERWIWWPLTPPPARTLQLRDVLEADAREWHSADQTRHILSLMSDRNRRKVESAKPGSVGTVYRRTRAGRQRAEVAFRRDLGLPADAGGRVEPADGAGGGTARGAHAIAHGARGGAADGRARRLSVAAPL